MNRASVIRLLVVAGIAAGLAWWGVRTLLPAKMVEDHAGLLTQEQNAWVSEYHQFLLRDHDIDYRVVSENKVADINQMAVKTFERLGDGMRSTTGRGLLLVIAPDEKLVRLEVSRSLEPVYTDAFVKYIEERQMVPFFASGRIADGILATTEMIVTRAQEARANVEFDASRHASKSAGGGAVSRIENAAKNAARGDGGFTPGATPGDTLKSYLTAMAARNSSPDLEIYTDETRTMLKSWTVTPAQMDNEVKSHRKCASQGTRARGQYAVIRYRIKDRLCAPYFFHKSGEGWQLDLTMMQKAIRFNQSNYWRFDMSVTHAYAFAFDDWRFDKNGFPIAVK
ncbi:MAG: TPM domain-containing protein [Hyphomicrobiales bacterium]|nr:TPM domain-containing protein [Hyphomicrobiales bacterium]